MLRVLSFLCVVAVCVIVPITAAAEGSDLAAALQKFDAGKKAFDARKFDEARAAFEASLALLPSPNTRLYIGRCYRAIGKTASAYTALTLAAREASDRLAASGETRYAATRDTATQEAAEIEREVPRLTVTVRSGAPAGFAVKVNGRERPRAAWGVAVETDPGEVVIEATGPRLARFRKVVTLRAGTNESVEIPLERVPTASLVIELATLPQGISVVVDGKALPLAGTRVSQELDVGEHVIIVTAPGYRRFRWSGPLANGNERTVRVALSAAARDGSSASHGTPKWLFFTASGATVVTAAAGTFIALNGRARQNEELEKSAYDRDPGVRDSIHNQAVWTDVLFVSSGVFAISAVALGFTTDWGGEHGRKSALNVSPWVHSRSGGVAADASF